jgi:hypothetical protein
MTKTIDQFPTITNVIKGNVPGWALAMWILVGSRTTSYRALREGNSMKEKGPVTKRFYGTLAAAVAALVMLVPVRANAISYQVSDFLAGRLETTSSSIFNNTHALLTAPYLDGSCDDQFTQRAEWVGFGWTGSITIGLQVGIATVAPGSQSWVPFVARQNGGTYVENAGTGIIPQGHLLYLAVTYNAPHSGDFGYEVKDETTGVVVWSGIWTNMGSFYDGTRTEFFTERPISNGIPASLTPYGNAVWTSETVNGLVAGTYTTTALQMWVGNRELVQEDFQNSLDKSTDKYLACR